MTTVPIDRVSSALRHLVREDGKPIKGLASVVRSIVTKDADVHAAPDDVFSSVCIQVSDTAQGVEAVRAAKEQIAGPSLALLQPELCSNPFDVQLACAELGDAGADAILLTMNGETGQEDTLREMVDMACEIDLLGVPMRHRLGLHAASGPAALKLCTYAHTELELLHFMSCLAGKAAARPSEVLKAVGMKPVDANFGSMYLAEFVPDAA